MRTFLYTGITICSVLLLGLMFSECGPRNPSQAQLILGKWSIDSLKIEGERQAPFVNTEGWIKFHTDNTFDSEGEPQGIIDGEWHIDEENGVLSISVNQNLSQQSKWDLSVEKKKMEWSNKTIEVNLAMTKT